MGEGIHDVSQSFLQDRIGHGLLEGELEDLQVGGQRVLVHGVHQRHFCQNEEEDGSPLSGRSVAVSQLLNVDRCLGS